MSNRFAEPTELPECRLAERRSGARFPCQWETPYRLGDEFGTAIVCDLSTTGAGLVLPRQVLPGMLVRVELFDEQRRCWCLKLLQVVRVAPRSPDTWLVGSHFTRQLSAEELQRLLRQESTGEP